MFVIKCFLIVAYMLVLFSQKVLCQNNMPGISHLQFDFNRVSQSVRPVVVNITAMETIQSPNPPNSLRGQLFFSRPFNPDTSISKKIGSGIIVDSRGYILTNYHVTAHAQDIHVTLPGLNTVAPEHFYEAQIVKQDINTDLAIIKIIPEHLLPVAKLGNSDTVKLGDWILAIGSPFGFEETISAGIISATNRSLSIEGKMYRDLFQTDASINYGNSGGPLVNMNGEVIGINTAIYSPDGTFAGLGFAIPINQAGRLISEVTGINQNVSNVSPWAPQQVAFNSPPYTQVTPEVVFVAGQRATAGYLGVILILQFCQTTQQYGLMVTSVLNGSPALMGDLATGDIIIRINNKKITNITDFDNVMDKTRPGNRIRVLVIRQGKKKRLHIKLGRKP